VLAATGRRREAATPLRNGVALYECKGFALHPRVERLNDEVGGEQAVSGGR
jgi:hypothetical protein